MNSRPCMQFNRLLDHRTGEQLSRMDVAERGALFEEVVKSGPSAAAWQALCELFATWPESAAKSRHLDRARQKLASWDDELRFLWSSNACLYDGEQLSSLASLAKSIRIYRREERGSAELIAIATSSYAEHLTRLDILRSEISHRAWQAMVESPHLMNLRHLHVTRVVLAREDIERFLQSHRLIRLQCLKLVDLGLRPEWLESMRQATSFTELRNLDFSENILGNEGILILANAPWLQTIQRIELRRNHVGAVAMQAMLGSPYCRQMNYIDFSGNPIGDGEKTALVKLANASNIRLLV